MKINISRYNKVVDGFTVKEGFIVFTHDNDKIIGVSSGWNDGNDMMYIYTLEDGVWVGDWESDYTFPVDDALALLNIYQKQRDMEELKLEIDKLLRDRVELYVSDETIRFVDEVAGEKSSDGGQYGFYSTYYPTDVAGIYEYHTSTTCEFDTCGTGYEGMVILTEDRYHYLANEERKLLANN